MAIGMTQSAILPAGLLAAALLSLFQLVRDPAAPATYLATREAHAVHVVMNGAMAVMATSLFEGVIRLGVVAALATGDGVLAVRCAIAARKGQPERMAGSLYHLFGMAVMTVATVWMPAMTGARHVSMAMMPGHPPLPATIAATIFALDGAATLLLAFVFPRALIRMGRRVGGIPVGAGDRAMLREARLSALPHVAMDTGMILMLV